VGVAVCEQRLGAHFLVAGHAMTRGCGLLSVGAALTGLISGIIRDRARGGYLVMDIAAEVIGVIRYVRRLRHPSRDPPAILTSLQVSASVNVVTSRTRRRYAMFHILH